MNYSANVFSHKLGKAAEGAIGKCSQMRKYMDSHFTRDQKLIGAKDFIAQLGTVINAIVKQYPLVAATEGKWAMKLLRAN